jgi:oligopeptide transport system ATP-binding protein
VTDPLLQVRGLGVDFAGHGALHDVSFDVAPAETLGLVGESGSGKTTLARALLRLIPATRGRVFWLGMDLLHCDAATLRRQRRDLQIVFQDPLASLNPRMSVGETLAEPLKIFEPALRAPQRAARIADMLERVGLEISMTDRYPHEFSGGQCQRIGIARAMMLRPKLLICDEPASALDVSIQGQIVNLLLDLQADFGTAMLFISHNLAVVRHLSHRVMVIYRGRIVEVADRDTLFAGPVHPYTRALLAAVPDPTRALAEMRPAAAVGPYGESPMSGAEPIAAGSGAAGVERRAHTGEPPGCAFRDRCVHAQPACALSSPNLEIMDSQHMVACHRRLELVYS